jgi:hypothetical protein
MGTIRLVILPPILEKYRRVGLALSEGREPLVGTLEALLAMLTVHALLVDAPPLDERVNEDPDRGPVHRTGRHRTQRS